MDISLIFKIAAVGILVSILSQVLKHSGREEQAFLASLAGLILVLSWVLPFNWIANIAPITPIIPACIMLICSHLFLFYFHFLFSFPALSFTIMRIIV